MDIFTLFGTNITNLLFEEMKKMCFRCDKVITSDDLVHLECSCQLCKSCLQQLITEATNGDMILNKFEKKRVSPIACCCNLPFNVENALRIFNQTNRDFKDKALQRLELYATHICMKCTTPLINEGEEHEIQKTNDEYFRLKILFNETPRDPNKEIAKVEHLICIKCVDKILKQDSIEKNKNKKMGAAIETVPTSKLINCKICEEEHVIDIKEWNSIFKRPCCQGCVIY